MERSEKAPREVMVADHAMVATSQPRAVETGLEILKRGGTAIDAAIATNAMLGLVEPMSCGLGGDLFALYWEAESEQLYGFNGSGRAPTAMTRAAFAERGLDRIPLHGPLSWTVPGCVDSWFALHDRFGRLPMSDLLEPTIEAAENGFAVTPVIARMWERAAERLAQDPGARVAFFPKGRAPKAGETVRNPDLASCLSALAGGGRDTFYRGPIADRIVCCAAQVGGLIASADLAAHTSEWVEPVSAPYRGYEVWELPPNTQGIAALQMLRLLEGFDIASFGPGSVEWVHRFIEAKKLAYEDRARFYADPACADVPIEALISAEYAEARRACIDPGRAATQLSAGDPRLRTGDTVYLTVVDEQGNAASLIQSIYVGFGSGVVPPGTGFAMQNRGNLFHLDPNHANALEPGKRPFHTIIPAMLTESGRPRFSFGVMGGDMQPQGHVQILANLLDFGMNVQEAGEAPRVRHVGSSTPTGDVQVDGGTVWLEPGFPKSVADGLRAKGHRVEIRDDGLLFGGYQGIWIDRETGTLHGGSEPRKDGCALGY